MKIVRGNKYFCTEAINDVPYELREIYLITLEKYKIKFSHNLVKINEDNTSMSLMYYPHLETNPHPYLKTSITIKLKDGSYKVKNESQNNPVILHRLELMLSENNPRIKKLKQLTIFEEKKGLYSDKHKLFLGRRDYWNKICRGANLLESLSPETEAGNGQLELFGLNEIAFKIKRESTAMHTRVASYPTRWAEEKHLIKNNIMDWGCGKGRDSNWLESLNYNVISYDPFFKPNPSPLEIDFSNVKTVLLNYVLNVIETEAERKFLLYEIYHCVTPKTILIVSARSQAEIGYNAKKSSWKTFNDGFLTSKNTFQKGFSLNELIQELKPFGTVIEKIEFEGGVACAIQITK